MSRPILSFHVFSPGSLLIAGVVCVSGIVLSMAAPEAPAVGTWFDGLGQPYGGCGVAQSILESEDFVALNVYHTPGSYSAFPVRPLQGADTAVMGEFANGRNCGRWVEVTLDSICLGTNDGAPGLPFCRGTGARWVADAYSGATLDLLVTDACGDGNAWCRDSRRHLDLSKVSLTRFRKDGKVMADLLPNHWNNRALKWKYIEAPGYSGDIRIHYLKAAKLYWAPIVITRLPKGIHAVEQWVDGAWKSAGRISDMGQAFQLTTGGKTYRIRLRDAEDQLVHGGREYVFSEPTALCGTECTVPATPVPYQAYNPDGTPAALAWRPRDMASQDRAQVRVVVHSGIRHLEVQASHGGPWMIRLHSLSGRLVFMAPFFADATGFGAVPVPMGHAGVHTVVLASGGEAAPAGRILLP